MIKRILALAVIALFAAGPAFASQCPADMKKIDEALAKNPKLSDADGKKVKQLRADGEKMHKDGKHADSVKTLGEAKKILKVQ